MVKRISDTSIMSEKRLLDANEVCIYLVLCQDLVQVKMRFSSS